MFVLRSSIRSYGCLFMLSLVLPSAERLLKLPKSSSSGGIATAAAAVAEAAAEAAAAVAVAVAVVF